MSRLFYYASYWSFLLGLIRSLICFIILGFLGNTDRPLPRSFSVLMQIESGVSCASTITSLIVAYKREITPVWIIPCFGLIAIGILNAAAILGLKFFINGNPGVYIFILVLYLVGGSIELVSLSGRHLVSSPWRLPRPFQPFVAKQRSEVMGQRLNVHASETALVDFEDTGPLSRQFRHDESEWQRSPETPSQVCGNFALQTHAYHLKRRCAVHDAEVRRDTERPQSQLRRSSSAYHVREVSHDGLCFDPNDRYWGCRTMRNTLYLKLTMRALCIGVLQAASCGIYRFVFVKKAGRPCQWYQSQSGFSFAPILTG